jgi:hypothetical protein
MDDDEDFEMFDDGTAENRVYLFRELARAFVERHGELFASDDPAERQRGMRALSLLAFASCEVADGEEHAPSKVAKRIAKGP